MAREHSLLDVGVRVFKHLQAAQAAQCELHERRWLRQEPWLEELLHWSYDGETWRLHGTRLPPDGKRRSVTRSGWCPGLARPLGLEKAEARPFSDAVSRSKQGM